jgi:hypothetical protein
LSHTYLLTDRGVTQSTRTDFTGDHLIGVQSHAQPKVDPVAVFDLSGQSGGLPLNAQRRKTTAERVILIAPGAPNTAMISVNLSTVPPKRCTTTDGLRRFRPQRFQGSLRIGVGRPTRPFIESGSRASIPLGRTVGTTMELDLPSH